MWFNRQHAKEWSFHWHLREVHGHVSKHFTWRNIFHAHGTILGIAWLKLLAAEAFVIKMLAWPALLIKWAIVAGMSAIPFFANAGLVTVADQSQPQVIKAQRASSAEDQQNQAKNGQPVRSWTKTISAEDSFRADLKNIQDGFAETPLYDPSSNKIKNKILQKSSQWSRNSELLKIPGSVDDAEAIDDGGPSPSPSPDAAQANTDDDSVGKTTLQGMEE